MKNGIKTFAIINPKSGVKSKEDVPFLLKKALIHTHNLKIVFTEYPGHGSSLAKKAISEGYKIIIAIGGDGTINEIAGELINTSTILAIIPMGSGNGLARHLSIPLNINDAIMLIKKNSIIKIDTGLINGKPFFCTAGMGFDAHVGQKFDKASNRGFWTYFFISIREYLNYKPKKFKIKTLNKKFKVRAFTLTIANATQFGNDVHISPFSNIRDGKMEICILRPFPILAAFIIAWRLFTGKIYRSKYYSFLMTEKVKITSGKKINFHIDGESMGKTKKLEVEIVPDSLHVLVDSN